MRARLDRIGADHDVAIHVAAGRDGVDPGLVDRGNGQLQVVPARMPWIWKAWRVVRRSV